MADACSGGALVILVARIAEFLPVQHSLALHARLNLQLKAVRGSPASEAQSSAQLRAAANHGHARLSEAGGEWLLGRVRRGE
jgi:hypothetical protein